jgi:hypothetical protein
MSTTSLTVEKKRQKPDDTNSNDRLVKVSDRNISTRPLRIELYKSIGTGFGVLGLLQYGPLFKPVTRTATGYWACTPECHPCDWNTWMAIITDPEAGILIDQVRTMLARHSAASKAPGLAWLNVLNSSALLRTTAHSFETMLQATNRKDLVWFRNHDRQNEEALCAIVYWLDDLRHLLDHSTLQQ